MGRARRSVRFPSPTPTARSPTRASTCSWWASAADSRAARRPIARRVVQARAASDAAQAESRRVSRDSAEGAEGERFELSRDEAAPNGFRDRNRNCYLQDDRSCCDACATHVATVRARPPRGVGRQSGERCAPAAVGERPSIRSYKLEALMARKSVFVLGLSGDEIPEGKGAKVRITFADARRGSAELDVTDEEAEELARKGRKTARRGRRPSAQSLS